MGLGPPAALPGVPPIRVGEGGWRHVSSGCTTPGAAVASRCDSSRGRGDGVARPGCASIGQFEVEFIRPALDRPPNPDVLGSSYFAGADRSGLAGFLGMNWGTTF